MKNVTWYGQGSLRIAADGKVIYTDPFTVSESLNDADIILITHRHFDHLSVDDIQKVICEKTIIAAPVDCVDEIGENFGNEITIVNPGEEYIISDMKMQTVRAYNIIKKECHPKGNDWLGYVIYTSDVVYYYTGDTEKIPEMNALDVDVIFLPLGQTYTMGSISEAADAAKATGAKKAVPVHYGTYEGTEQDVLTLKILLEPDVEVVVLGRTQ